MNLEKPARRTAAIVAALSLFLQPLAPMITAQSQTTAPAQTAPKPATQPAPSSSPPAASAANAAPIDGGWPRAYQLPSGSDFLLYQPQISTWEKQKHLVAFSAVSYRDKAANSKPALGTIKLEADTQVALDDRLVNFQNMKIVETNFPDLPKEQVREIVAEVDKAIPDEDKVIALDRVLVESRTRARSSSKTWKALRPIRRQSSSAKHLPWW